MTPPGSKHLNWNLLVAFLTLLFGSGLAITVWQQYQNIQEPKFTITAINTLGTDKVYETTNHFIGIDANKGIDGVTLTWGLEVIPEYRGDKQFGEVRVEVKNSKGDVLASGKWDNLTKDSNKLSIPLNPFSLSNEVGQIDFTSVFQDNIFETGNYKPPETTFDIVIIQASKSYSPIYKDKIIVRNSPWYFYSAISAWHGNSIDVFVQGKNLGDKSDFAIVCDVFEITDLLGWAWNPWPRVDTNHIIKTADAGGNFFATLSFPNDSNFQFVKGKMYLLAIYVVKNQIYAKFKDGTWNSSSNIWMLGSNGDSLILKP